MRKHHAKPTGLFAGKLLPRREIDASIQQSLRQDPLLHHRSRTRCGPGEIGRQVDPEEIPRVAVVSKQ